MEKIEKCPVCHNNQFDVFLEVQDYFLTQEQFTIVNCRSCGFKFTNPRPKEENLSVYYKSEEYISHSNTKNGLINKIYHFIRNHNHKSKYSIIKKFQKNGKSILDIGCATGEFLNFFKEKGWTTFGIEPGTEARKFAEENYKLEVFDENKIATIPNQSFDVISMWHVLEHVPHLNQRISELKRILNDKGILLIAVPNSNSYDAIHYKNYWAAYDVPRHLYHFNPITLKEIFTKHGFEIAKILPMKFDSYYVSLLSEKYKNKKTKLLKAFYIGLKSNLKANKIINNSSIIFVLKKS
jgi:2-polyprenyl-3-methyl-5-hydroxy-6-metoxy-1,4-benzoquinol methylase